MTLWVHSHDPRATDLVMLFTLADHPFGKVHIMPAQIQDCADPLEGMSMSEALLLSGSNRWEIGSSRASRWWKSRRQSREHARGVRRRDGHTACGKLGGHNPSPRRYRAHRRAAPLNARQNRHCDRCWCWHRSGDRRCVGASRRVTGLERTFALNHMGYFPPDLSASRPAQGEHACADHFDLPGTRVGHARLR